MKNKGFTLIELMIVVAIVAILASVAMPSFTDSADKTRRAKCQGTLIGFAQAMEAFHIENGTYVGATSNANGLGPPTIFSSTCPVDGSSPHYNLKIKVATATDYTLVAVPAGSQKGDGIFFLTGTGSKGWDEDGSEGDRAGRWSRLTGTELNWKKN